MRRTLFSLALAGLIAAAPPMVCAQAGGVITVQGAAIGATVSLGGTVVPHKTVTLSAQMPGRIEVIAGEEGDEFKAGDVLVEINKDDLLAKRRSAWAQLSNADAALRNAGVQYSRQWVSPYGGEQDKSMGGMPSMFNMFSQPMRSMSPTGGSPGFDRHAELVSGSTRVEQAQNAIVQARARIDEIDTKLRDTKSLAPFDGVITRKLVEVGDAAQPGQPMLEYADTKRLQAQIEIPARLMPGVRTGMVVPARLDVGNTRISVRVARIFPIADANRHTVRVKFDLPPGAPGAPGMYVEVMIQDINANVRQLPVIPLSAVTKRGGLNYITVVGDNNQGQRRVVRLGEPIGSGTVSVLSGVQVGDRILGSPPR